MEENEKIDIPILYISPEVEKKQVQRLTALRQSRNQEKVKETLNALHDACEDGSNLMPKIIECSRAYVSLQEMTDTMKEVFGVYEEQAVF